MIPLKVLQHLATLPGHDRSFKKSQNNADDGNFDSPSGLFSSTRALEVSSSTGLTRLTSLRV